MNQQLRADIETHLASLSHEPQTLRQLSALLYEANVLLERVVSDDDKPRFIVPKNYTDFYIENTEEWCSAYKAAVFTEEEARNLVKAMRRKYYNSGAYAVPLTTNQKHLVE